MFLIRSTVFHESSAVRDLALLVLLVPSLVVAEPPGTPARADITLRDGRVLTLLAARGGVPPAARARAASLALADALEGDPAVEATVETRGDTASILLGKVPVLELGPEDVAAAGGPGISELARSTAAEFNRALRAERRRATLAGMVFHVSLVVLSGLVAWLLLRKLGDLDRGLAATLRERRRRAPALRLRGVEVVSPEGVAGALAVAVRVGRVALQVVVAYAWLVFALSLFPSTRGAGLQLGRVILGPAAGTLARVGGALPVTIAALVAGALLLLALRAVRLFFHSIASGETHLRGVPAELAVPVGQLVRIALVLLAATFAGPVLTGSDEGVLATVGQAALLAVALAAAPALANVAAGLPRLLGRVYRTGHVAEIGGTSGVVRSVGLQDVEVEDATGRRVLVPHLATLISPTRLPGLAAAARFDLSVDPSEDQSLVREILLRTGGPGTAADLVRLDASGALYRVSGPGVDLAVRVASALRAEGVKLGGPHPGAAGAA
jgi:small-conductance mechanosensitive channel